VGHLEDQRLVRFIVRGLRKMGEEGHMIREIDMGDMDLTDCDAQAVAENILEPYGESITRLSVRFGPGNMEYFNDDAEVTSDGIEAIMSALSDGNCPNLTQLHINTSESIGFGTTESVMKALGSDGLPRLQELHFGMEDLKDSGVVHLSSILRQGKLPYLRRLRFHMCSIGETGAVSLASALRSGVCRRLESLELSHNPYDQGDDVTLHLMGARGSGACRRLKHIR